MNPLLADPQWQMLDFISDLHLQASHASTFDVWQRYLAQTEAHALFILGDLFEVWVGEDLMAATDDPQARFILQCQQVLQATAARLPVFFMHGNRDFLLDANAASNFGMQLLDDPTLLDFDGQRWLLSHGDALCLDDTDYQQFRQQVRSPAWQTAFLTKPLSERQQIARSLRAQSDARKQSGASYADVDTPAACDWLRRANASTLIHGHTHRPGDHLMDARSQPALRRVVLSDWDAQARPPRLEVLRLQRGQAPQRVALTSGL